MTPVAVRIAPLALLVACAGEHTFRPPDTTDTSETGDTGVIDTDTDDTEDTDTDVGTDLDKDGWTVEEGDCDDDDIWVNPAWTERKNDGKDNNCNGLVDEAFAGVSFVDSGNGTTLSDLSLLGDISNVRGLGGMTPGGQPPNVQIGPSLSGEGFAYTDGAGKVGEIDGKGVPRVLWDDTTTEYAEGDEPFGYFGVARHPDGWYAVSGGDRLFKVESDGTATVIAQWDCLEGMDYTTDLCPVDVGVDPFTGVVVLFGYFGGYAEWSEGPGFQLLVPDNIDPYASVYNFWSTQVLSNGARVAMGSDPDGHVGMFDWDDETSAYTLRYQWPDAVIADAYTPADFAVDEISGDLYATANRDWFPYVWRLVPDVEQASVLYPPPGTYDPFDTEHYQVPAFDHAVQSIVVRYSTAN